MNPSQQLLILYTGGTIGMQMSAAGLVPASGFEARLRTEQAAQPQRLLPPWQFVELQPLLDSANMTQANWLAMRDAIVRAVEVDGCDAVLLLHGTDTLAYSAAALSFLLLGLAVPVILTGAMLPAGVAGTDAWINLFGAMQLLGSGVAPGVHLYFNGQLLHGTHASKLNSEALDAFADTQRPYQAVDRIALPAHLHYQMPRREVALAVQPLFPGLQACQLRALLDSDIQALVLECFGGGTGPSENRELMTLLRQAHERGIVLLAISQCPHGAVNFGTYAAGSALAACGLVSGAGLSREAALGKLFSLLGCGLDQTEVERLLVADLCGELNGKQGS